MTYNRSEILRKAHAAARARRAWYPKLAPTYRAALAWALRAIWVEAKRVAAFEARKAADPRAARIASLEAEIMYEEAAERGYRFERVAELRREIATLRAAA